jgi:hypothetical protein
METYQQSNLGTYFGKLNGSNMTIDTMGYTDGGMNIPTYLYILVSLVNSIIFIIGTFGNILVIIVVLKVQEMRTPTNVFLLNLSVADVFVLLVCQPAGLLEFFGKDRWFLGEFMCKQLYLYVHEI